MPLSQSVLKQEILNAFNQISQLKDGPGGIIDPRAVTALASAYDNYVQKGVPLAGVLSISVPPVVATLAGFLNAPLLAGFTPGLAAYWAPVLWAAPGFIPANPTVAVPSPTMTAQLAAVLQSATNNKSSASDVADQIATVLHTYTTGLQVTATTTSVPPVTSTLPVV